MRLFPNLRPSPLVLFLMPLVSFAAALSFSPGISFADAGRCVFDKSTLVFAGDAGQQARCLLSPVKMYARLEAPITALPRTLNGLIGQPVLITPEALRAYLVKTGLTDDDVGGALEHPVARTNSGHPALYFVIHDTSTPYFGNRGFPDDLNSDAAVNSFTAYRSSANAKAHVFVNRRGEVYLGHDFSTPWRATKLELGFAGTKSRGRFIHIELVQPRRRDPSGGAKNDAVAPEPGFTEAQYRRLAELYTAASLRAGVWLIPAYHAVLDSGFSGGHDDPQHFDLAAWDASLATLIVELQQ